MKRIFNKTKNREKRNPRTAINRLPFTIHHSPLTKKGQVILEFTFCMVIVLLMIYGITQVFIWVGREYAGRANAHDETLYLEIDPNYDSIGKGPAKQIDPYFYTPVKMNAIWTGM